MYNKVWEVREITNTLKHTTITHLLKEEKDSKDVRSFKPVALTNILCKIFEKMTNKRLATGKGEENRWKTVRLSETKKHNGAISTIFNAFWRKKKTTAIFFDIEKPYDKVNREDTW